MSGVISELSPPKTDVSFGVSINHLCEVECSALRLFLERVLPSRVLQRERRKVGNGSLFLGFSPSRVPLPPPIPSGRLFSDRRVEHVSLQIAPRSKDSGDESFSPSGRMCIHVHVHVSSDPSFFLFLIITRIDPARRCFSCVSRSLDVFRTGN